MTTTTSPRDRLLATASRLFYGEGIHTVGVDRLVAEAGVTRMTFYRHFPSKDDLVASYLRSSHERLRAMVEERLEETPPDEAVAALVELVGNRVCTPDFRGCEFINAAAEYPDPDSPVRAAVAEHRRWFERRMARLARAAGHPDPRYAASVLVLLHDGALAAGDLDDPAKVRRTLTRVVRELFEPVRG